MSIAATRLLQLKTELGEHALLLKHAPLHHVAVEKVEDPASVSFKIEFGNLRGDTDKDTDVGDRVYIHLYPATGCNQHPEIQFHSVDSMGNPGDKHDSDNISQTVSKTVPAFNLPARRSRGKVLALAKYYFLELLAQHGDHEDNQKLKFGFPISKTFKEDLKTVCRDFEKAAHKAMTSMPVQNRNEFHGEPQAPYTPNMIGTMRFPADEDDDRTVCASDKKDSPKTMAPPRLPFRTDHGTNYDNTATQLFQMIENNALVPKRLAEIDLQIAHLQATRQSIMEEHVGFEAQRDKMLQGKTMAEVFQLGQDLERMRAEKARHAGS